MSKRLILVVLLSVIAAAAFLQLRGDSGPAKAKAAETHRHTSDAEEDDHAGLICHEHQVPEDECGICQPDLLAELKPGEELMLRLPSAASLELVGVKIAEPTVREFSERIECYAEIVFNQNRLAQITAPADGLVKNVLVEPGSQVAAQQVLALIWSPSVASAVARAVLSHQTLKREQSLHARRISPERELQRAEAEHREVCQQLRTLGFSEEQIDDFAKSPQENVYLELRAPFAGEIVDRTAVLGARVKEGEPLFILADRSLMWAELSVPEQALAVVKPGQMVEVSVDSLPGRMFTGRLAWVGPEVDFRSRMAKARVELPNSNGLLRANMFAEARILARVSEEAVIVPAAAVQQVGEAALVFVKQTDDLFSARRVVPGARLNGEIEILQGLRAGELLAVEHAFTLKSQLLISRLGAGCADE